MAVACTGRGRRRVGVGGRTERSCGRGSGRSEKERGRGGVSMVDWRGVGVVCMGRGRGKRTHIEVLWRRECEVRKGERAEWGVAW